MDGSLATPEIEDFLHRLGDRYAKPGVLYLLGGGALCFLGSARRTVDIDYALAQSEIEALDNEIKALANEMRLELEAVPIEEFIPLPAGSEDRHRWLGQFNQLNVYIYDPYSIAISKLSRGFESDLQDVAFLLKQQIINLDELARFVEDTIPHAWDYEIDPNELRLYFEEVKKQM